MAPRKTPDLILPFKRATRIDEGMLEATDLYNLLEEIKTELKNKLGASADKIKINIKKSRTVFTDTVAMREGLAKILESMISNSTGSEIVITTDAVDGDVDRLGKYVICIIDHAGEIKKPAKVRSFFGNKLRVALKHLRGYVDWSISASFSDGNSYVFDVMKNNRIEPAQHYRGIQHALTFYRHEP